MRSFHYFVFCLALLLCLHSVSAVPYQPARRQDGSPSNPSPSADSTSARSSRPSATSAPVSSASKSDSASSIVSVTASPSSTLSSALMDIPNTASTPVPNPTSSAAAASKNPLPIQPKVTPAMGITGALLLITGLVYTVIGIKNKWIYVFGSAAYLTALAVTVLIIYLMNAPVSNGVQGAFFVAAFFTGLIFGGLSLVFSDITEGFGCLLGGFCLSMWFLSLKDGGLITSQTGRAIFIGCMSAGGYSLSFSRYTRNYGLIASISFSGATATILGIDCLSRAGWKEFWLYLWNLNDSIFPLNTNTYPVTKNIKAELAGVVIIAVFGIVSQLRVWNLVKEHREKSAAQELQKQQEQDREEEERGRTVEDRFQRERAQWEAAYGNKSNVESSVRSSSIATPKGSTSIREKEVYATDSVEMVNMSKAGVAANGTTVTVGVLRDDDIQQIDAHGKPVIQGKPRSIDTISTADKELPAHPAEPVPQVVQSLPSKTANLRASVPPPPAVIPLPFKIPTETDNRSEHGNDSVSAVPESNVGTDEIRRPISKRISDMSVTRRFSNRRSRALSDSAEALVPTTHIEDDRASSVAATLDDDNDNISIRELSPPHSPIQQQHNVASLDTPAERPDNDVEADHSQDQGDSAENPTRPAFRQSLTSSTDPKPNESTSKWTSKQDPRDRADTLVSHDKSGSEQGQYSKSSSSHVAGSHVGSLSDGVLPARLSKVALSYRTNEWAKHLEGAERPDLEDISAPASPGVILEAVSEEKPAPISDDTAYPLPGSKRTSRRTSLDPAYNADPALNRSQSTFSQTSLIEQRNNTRTPSNPSPRVLSRSNSGAQLDALAPLPSNTLLGQRESLMKKRTSSSSFTPNSSASNLLSQADQENLTLAQRRQLLQNPQSQTPGLIMQASSTAQRKAPPSASQKWQNKGWATHGAPLGFDSHQPKRTSSSQSDARREELYAGWRNNMQTADVATPQGQAYAAEQQRLALIAERRQKEVERQKREAAQQQRASMMESMMRSGHMLDAHREAMRKMQAGANRSAS